MAKNSAALLENITNIKYQILTIYIKLIHILLTVSVKLNKVSQRLQVFID